MTKPTPARSRQLSGGAIMADVGRPITAADVRDAVIVSPLGNDVDWPRVADHLNRIARPSGGVGHPGGSNESRKFVAVPVAWVDHDEDDGDLHETGFIERIEGDNAVINCDCGPRRVTRPLSALTLGNVAADPSPRSWSLPAPPPDDVTVVPEWVEQFMQAFSDAVASGTKNVGAAFQRWMEQQQGTVVEGEPQAAESASVILFKPSGKYYTEERWVIPSDAIGPYDMERSPDFRRIGGGAVLVETQEPWGFPHLFPGVAAAGAVRGSAQEAREHMRFQNAIEQRLREHGAGYETEPWFADVIDGAAAAALAAAGAERVEEERS